MSGVNGISSTSTAWSNLNSTGSTSTKTSSASEWMDKLHEIINGTSGSSDSDNSSGSETTIERTVSTGPDGSMIVTLTQVTTTANGSRTSKVISKTKMGCSTDGNISGKSSNGISFTNAQAQGIMAKNRITSNHASNEYEKNSDIGAYVSGTALIKER
ncbi:MAG: hypothetical protein K0R78_2862 [Pelosinus sp.]|nr:hypothetical protein [Pelosinus sp.]